MFAKIRLGDLQRKQNKLREALSTYEEAKKILEQLRNPEYIAQFRHAPFRSLVHDIIKLQHRGDETPREARILALGKRPPHTSSKAHKYPSEKFQGKLT